ncbi:bifunctional diaminohydroxyphosphoribosylaminopyrimidine deaminase/5-amino-6-(5-phosphoribosylamino)uracil reductase RibD [Hyphomicrobium sp. CS1GBMeth3]|uniref:bifunctional diaminohydroxyphosphoribosylaminopyrimidine deaminase/5-amino-6-(5-phosphoribosylamino)uracil reductase RibD n=1 Tax=Hyphomicrobium sp. CS1GBMeth3 TaxID=1892845 RepID=UPI000931FE70|nr:bifunctional diaminohydroxyphosphoribosylaminopyrimidine deaminase/5-amino-6-(5-phosphoribosylamino)uracil reductase RibD [Hyphomicrobium sp. CS1GBMeth3]
MSFSSFDAHMMQIALMLARRGLGTAAPNPSVGAVVADEATGELIARGVTQPGGRPHAEPVALGRAGARAQGATLYVTLEPCAHFGKTPPCADAVVAGGLKRVVIGVEDPDPRTRGDGIARLRDAGITVEVGLAGEDARWVTMGHILRVTERRPFVQLKMAFAEDGTIPRGADGRARMVTGLEARALAHRLRAEADAILVGAGTARDDDPELTCRLPGLAGRSPTRVVLSRGLDLPDGLKLVRSARDVPSWVFSAEQSAAERTQAFEAAGVRLERLPAGDKGLVLREVLARLADAGVTRLLVEGGEAVWQAFADAGLVDEVVIFQAGAAGGEPTRLAELAARYAQGLDLALTAHRSVGADAVAFLRARQSVPL